MRSPPLQHEEPEAPDHLLELLVAFELHTHKTERERDTRGRDEQGLTAYTWATRGGWGGDKRGEGNKPGKEKRE